MTVVVCIISVLNVEYSTTCIINVRAYVMTSARACT